MDDFRLPMEGLHEEIGSLPRQLAERDVRIAELEAERRRRGKKYRPKANAAKRPKKTPDRRKKPHRQHAGVFREPPVSDKNTLHHDVRLET